MVTIQNYEEFAKDFERYYLWRGFGSMNKNELEVLFFHLMKEHCPGFKEKSIFQLACELRTSESKIKRLSYEAELSYGKMEAEDKKALQERFLSLLAKAKLQKENGTLRFVVEDKYLRSVIYEDLKQQGYYLDSSFNSEIVSIQKDALIALLDMYYSKKEKDAITNEYKKTIKKVKNIDVKDTFKQVMSTVFEKVCEDGTDKVIDGLGTIDYTKLIQFISGGVQALGKIVKVVAWAALF